MSTDAWPDAGLSQRASGQPLNGHIGAPKAPVNHLNCTPIHAVDSIAPKTSSRPSLAMAQYYPQQPQQGYAPQGSAQNLQFFPSSYGSVSGHTTPSQAAYGGGFGGAPNPAAQAYPGGGYGGFGSPGAGVSGRMGEQGGLRTGWLAAFGTEGYDGEPPLLEELGVNFEHIRTKVSCRSLPEE